MTSQKSKVKLFVILGVIAVSFGSIIIKSSTAPSIIIATYRMLLTVIILTPFILSDLSCKKELKNINSKNLLLCIASGFFLAMHFVTWISSLKYTSINSSTILVNTHPLFIVIFSYFFLKETYNLKTIFAIIITLIGGILISWGDFSISNTQLLGDVLAISGGFFVSGYILIGNVVRKDLSAKSYCYVVYGFSVIFLLSFSLLSNSRLIGYPVVEYLKFLGLAFVCTILGHTVFNWALAYIEASFVSISILGEPVFASLWAILFFGEIPSLIQSIGSIIVLIGIIMYFVITDSSTSMDKG